VTIREHHVIGLAALAIILAFLWAGETQAQQWTGHVVYPKVIDHPGGKSIMEVTAICEDAVQEEVACAVVTIDDKVCFAYMDEYGHADWVNCFPEIEEGDTE